MHLIEKQPDDDRYVLPGGFDPTEKHIALVVESLEEKGIPYGATELTVPPGILLKLIVVKDPDGNSLQAETGFDSFSGLMNFGGLEHKKVMRSTDLFAERVIPVLKKSP